MPPDKLGKIDEEIADVFLYLIRLADMLNVDLIQVADGKIEKNAEKYPWSTTTILAGVLPHQKVLLQDGCRVLCLSTTLPGRDAQDMSSESDVIVDRHCITRALDAINTRVRCGAHGTFLR